MGIDIGRPSQILRYLSRDFEIQLAFWPIPGPPRLDV